VNPGRRTWLRGAAALPWALAACAGEAPPPAGGWVGAGVDRGHRLRETRSGALPAPAVQRRVDVVIVGGGIAGLAAARALSQAGIDAFAMLELEDEAGGNSRGHAIAGMACPLGAHYLPLPGDAAVEVAEWLDELGLRRVEHGRVVYDERHLCHSPQERLLIGGEWHEGLLPPLEALPAAERATTRDQYRRFAAEVARLGTRGAFTVPTARSRWGADTAALDGLSFAAWLDAQRFDAPALRWYLDYCCRDDYGAGAARVSAWAGVHYFASRHGFAAPGDAADEREGVLTWPEGNAWLARRLAAPLGDRLQAGRVVLRVREGRHAVEVDAWDATAQRLERWTAAQAILAVPLFVAARLLEPAPPALAAAAAVLAYAPWLVANLHLDAPLLDRAGAAPAWDNVRYGSASLGYVDAMHQSLRPVPGPTVLTAYWALGGDTPAQAAAERAALLAAPWAATAATVRAELALAHADLPAKVRRIDLMRYGHAMAIPAPGVRGSAALRALAAAQPRVQFAHADLSGHSVFEEAWFHGQRAGLALRGALRGRRAQA